MNTHETKPKPPVFLSNLIYFFVRQICTEGATDEEFGGKLHDTPELLQTLDIADINAPEIAYVRIIF
jgi:hypothetical protein